MRAALNVAYAIALISFATSMAQAADDQSDEQPIPWQNSFEAISTSRADEALVLMVITNEDPFAARERAAKSKAADADPDAKKVGLEQAGVKIIPRPPIWCASVLETAYRKAVSQRPDLRERLTLQSVVAGLPKELTGGKPRNHPSRAVVALCDGQYRLLALAVGIPDTTELLTLIEDGEEVATIRQLNSDSTLDAVKAISERSSGRLSRLWKSSLSATLASMQGELREGEARADDPLYFQGLMRSLGDAFAPTYLADVQLRFGLVEATDKTRLVILEQHPEARRPWCEAMIPFAAGCEMPEIWRELVESVWGHQPIAADADVQDLLDWYDLQTESEVVVLSLRSRLNSSLDSWPPPAGKFKRRGVSWQDAHALALERPFREVDPQQFATLIQQRELDPVDIEQPSTLRYVLFDPNRKAPLVFRESDPPGRFAGTLKRTKPSKR